MAEAEQIGLGEEVPIVLELLDSLGPVREIRGGSCDEGKRRTIGKEKRIRRKKLETVRKTYMRRVASGRSSILVGSRPRE